MVVELQPAAFLRTWVKLTMEIVRGERDVLMTVGGRVSEGFAFRESSMELAIYTKE